MPLPDYALTRIKPKEISNKKLWFLGILWNLFNNRLSPNIDDFCFMIMPYPEDICIDITYFDKQASPFYTSVEVHGNCHYKEI